MMKKMQTAVVSCALALFLVASLLPAPAAAQEFKIAILSIQKVIDQSQAGQEARKVLEAKQSEMQPKFKKEQDALQAQAKEIEKKSSVWSEEVRIQKEREYQKNMREFQLKAEDAQFELKQLQKKVLDPIFKELQKLITDLGKREGYSMIFEKSKSNGLLYADDALDITDMVIKELDARHGK